LVCLILALFANAQTSSWEVSLKAVEDKDEVVGLYTSDHSVMNDSISIAKYLGVIVSEIQLKGYLLANIDSLAINHNEKKAEVWIYVGERYKWSGISFKTISGNTEVLEELGTDKWIGKELTVVEFETVVKEILEHSENNGYPFASIYWDSLSVHENRLNASLIYDMGPLIVYDSLYIKGDIRLKPDYLSSYLDVYPGKPFRQKRINEIPERLDNLEFLKLEESPYYTFQNEEVRIILELEKKKANRFDAIIGFLPNDIEENKLLVTGAVDLSLSNLFQSGKHLEFHWDRLQKSTQTLSLLYLHPNLFRSPLGLAGDFYLYKQDTTFLNRKMSLGIDYSTGRYGKVSLGSKWESSRLISTTQYQEATTIPDLADFNVSYFSLGFSSLNKRVLNYGSKKKWGTILEAALGSKVIKENSELNSELYNDIDLKSIQFSGIAALEGIYTFPSKPYALFGKLSGGLMINDQLFLNDLFRLGGLNSLRGFNENTFYASNYLIGTIEIQAYFNKDSRIFAFMDYGYLQYSLSNTDFSDQPFGTGIGLAIESGDGLFSFVYAIGKSEEQPLSLRYSKIHFGYKAVF
jgi:outer membrane protein assembly factor BamA